MLGRLPQTTPDRSPQALPLHWPALHMPPSRFNSFYVVLVIALALSQTYNAQAELTGASIFLDSPSALSIASYGFQAGGFAALNLSSSQYDRKIGIFGCKEKATYALVNSHPSTVCSNFANYTAACVATSTIDPILRPRPSNSLFQADKDVYLSFFLVYCSNSPATVKYSLELRNRRSHLSAELIPALPESIAFSVIGLLAAVAATIYWFKNRSLLGLRELPLAMAPALKATSSAFAAAFWAQLGGHGVNSTLTTYSYRAASAAAQSSILLGFLASVLPSEQDANNSASYSRHHITRLLAAIFVAFSIFIGTLWPFRFGFVVPLVWVVCLGTALLIARSNTIPDEEEEESAKMISLRHYKRSSVFILGSLTIFLLTGSVLLLVVATSKIHLPFIIMTDIFEWTLIAFLTGHHALYSAEGDYARFTEDETGLMELTSLSESENSISD